MAEPGNWAFPAALQPSPDEARFDLAAALDAVVLLRAEIPEDAFTASILGTERAGNGVVIRDDGLVLTIGYLITEAESIWLTTNRGTVVQGHALAYDQGTGFGLVHAARARSACARSRADRPPPCKPTAEVIVIGHGGRAHSLKAKIIAKREFAGYWEYVLDEALFTAPAHPQWGGAALVGEDGRLLGIGSLLVQESVGGKAVDGNMFVPIDLLAPILDEMLATGRAGAPAARLARHLHHRNGRPPRHRRPRARRPGRTRRREARRPGAGSRRRARRRASRRCSAASGARTRRQRGHADAVAPRRVVARSRSAPPTAATS